MAAVVPALIFFAQTNTPRYFTNAENVRRIAAGKRFVAFATSGGVRVFERETQKWRVFTQNEGLPTHNIHDVVFDKTKPDTLWVLCGSWGDWANEQPEPDLRIVTLDLSSGKIESVAPPTSAPRTERRGYPYFLNYRLSITDGWAFVFTDKGAALAWDRSTQKWTRELTVEAPAPRPSVYPGHASQLELVGSSESTLAFFIRTKLRFINQSRVITPLSGGAPVVANQLIAMEEGLPPHILLYDRATGRSTRHSLGQDLMGASTVFTNAKGTVTKVMTSGRPQRLIPDSRPDAFLIESLASELVTNSSKEGDYSVTSMRIRHRVAPNLREPVAISQEKITEAQARQVRQATRVPLVYVTDFLVEGNTLWVTGYNDPNSLQRSGVAWLDLTTGKWDSPKPSATGIPANFASVGLMQKTVVSLGGFVIRRYDPLKDEFMASSLDSFAENPYSYNVLIPEPRVVRKNEDNLFGDWFPLRVLGQNGNQSLVVGPPTPTPRVTRDANGRVIGPGQRSGPDVYFFFDVAARKLTPLELRGLEGLQPKAAGFGQNGLFFLTEEKAPGERRGTPVVVRWDSKTGVVKRYPELLFRDVSVAVQRLAGVQQQADLKSRQRGRAERQKRFPQLQEPPVELRPPMEFLRPLSGSFLKAAGTTWLRLDQHLFRYDARQDTWLAEGLADSLSPEGESALWKQAGPEWWRFEGFDARRLRGEIARWSQETGWQKLALGGDARQASNSMLFHDGALWLTGVGALRLPQSAWVFQKKP